LQKDAPFFTKPLSGGLEVAEGDNVYLEVQYGPTNDNSLAYEWLVNGQPLMKAHRFVLSQDFGFAALNILYMIPEDSGQYTLVIRNGAGQEASSSVDIQCAPKDRLFGGGKNNN
jgi:membrane carboxypeptidase/penicillin-binding protein PbpC